MQLFCAIRSPTTLHRVTLFCVGVRGMNVQQSFSADGAAMLFNLLGTIYGACSPRLYVKKSTAFIVAEEKLAHSIHRRRLV
jgi:hypothetical protein